MTVKTSRSLTLALALLALLQVAPIWPRRADVTPPGPGYDYSSDTAALGCWVTFDDSSSSTAQADNCVADSSNDSLTWVGNWAYASGPAGSASGSQGADHQNSNDYFYASDGSGEMNAFEAIDFSAGCWINPDNIANDMVMSKDDKDNYEFKTLATGAFHAEVNDGIEQTPIFGGSTSWYHWAVTYDGSSTQTIKAYINGGDACNAGCDSGNDPTGNADDFVIGANESKGGDYNGLSHECWYRDEVLTRVEIEEIVLCGYYGDATGATRESNYGSDACTSSGQPWPCCTGLGLGTCAECADLTDSCCS